MKDENTNGELMVAKGRLGGAVARKESCWAGESFGLSRAVKALFDDVKNFPDRTEAVEFY